MKLYYRVKQIGYDEDLDWYLVSDLKYALYKLKSFYLEYPEKPGPLINLGKQIEAYDNGIEDYDDLDNDIARYA